MKDYTYEVRGVNDPIDGEVVRFHSKQEALEYSDEMKSLYPDNTVYMVEWDFDDEFGFDGAPTKTQEIQIRGPEVAANLADPAVPNSCDVDKPDNYDEEGNFRLPTFDDDLDDDIADEATDEGLVGVEDIPVEEIEETIDGVNFEPFPCVNEIWEFANEEPVDGIYKLVKTQEYKYDPEIDGPRNTISDKAYHSFRQRPNAALTVARNLKDNTVKVIQWSPKIEGKTLDPVGMSAEDQEAITNQFKTMFADDDIENESFVEDLFNALSTKRSEEVFPKGDLDLEAPHKDVPVVDCDVNPVITHSEDEKPLVEAVNRSDEFYDALEDNAPAQMYVARELTYSLVDDEVSAKKLADWGNKALDLDEQVALDSLIADALEGANEHMAMMDYLDDRTLPVTLSFKLDDASKQTMNTLIASCKSEQEKLDLLFQAINFLVLDGYLD